MTMLDEVQAPAVKPAAVDERLDPRVVRGWRVNAAIGGVIWTAVAVLALLVAEWSVAWALIPGALAVGYAAYVPPARWRHFAFRIGEVDVRVAHGWLWRTESVVLHSRIQHVDTRQGPVERWMGLATVVLFTAGTVGASVGIPGLAAPRAEALRDELVRLSGADDGV
jgi:uncharacterized protein